MHDISVGLQCGNAEQGMIHHQQFEAWKQNRVKANSNKFIIPPLEKGQAFLSTVKSASIFSHKRLNSVFSNTESLRKLSPQFQTL